MAGNSIASLNVRLMANISGFASGMAAATKPLASFAGSVVSTSLKVGGLVSAITGLVGAGSMAALVTHSMDAIDANAKLADRLGFTTEKLTGLQHVAALSGVSSEDLNTALEHMLKGLNEAAEGSGPAADAFHLMGLNAKQLANETPDQAFKDIADGLKSIPNPAQRAATEMDLFGKSGQSIGKLLMSGSEGIAAAQKEAQLLGLTFDRVSAAKVEAANDSFTRLQGVITGVGNQLAIGLSPYIDAAVSKIVELSTAGGGIGPKIGSAVEWVAKAVATASDYVGLFKVSWKELRAGVDFAIYGILEGLDYVTTGVEKLLNLLPGVHIQIGHTLDQYAQGFKQSAKELNREANEAFDDFAEGKNANAVSKVFDDIRTKSQQAAQSIASNAQQMQGAFKDMEDSSANLKKVTDTLADLQKQVNQFGLTDAQKKLDDLKSLGASPEQLTQAKKLADQLDALNEAKKKQGDLQSQAKSVLDSIQTPMQKYESQITNLDELLNHGLLSWDQYGEAVRKAKGELEKSTTAPKLEAPDLIKAGSAQAARLAYQANRGSQKVKDEIPQKQLTAQQKTNYLLDRIDRNTKPIVNGDADTTLDV